MQVNSLLNDSFYNKSACLSNINDLEIVSESSGSHLKEITLPHTPKVKLIMVSVVMRKHIFQRWELLYYIELASFVINDKQCLKLVWGSFSLETQKLI
jgi:hypothetical protein